MTDDEKRIVDLAQCQNCGKLAVWDYAPSGGIGEYCDDCVPRGCSCNIIEWDDPRALEQHKDELGRLLPCAEYWFMADGFAPSERGDHRKD